jgi:uncharacterized membrane protein (DUF2068 family)
MTGSASQSVSKPTRHNRWLILIAAFKLSQAALFIALGVGAFRLVGKDVGDLLTRLAEHLHFTSEPRFIDFILEKSSLVNDHLLRRIGAAVFIYAGLDLIEGIGLYLEKTWAEYLTLAITASFLPWEIFEVLRRVTWIRSGLLTANALVVFYLLKMVIERGRERRRELPPIE